MITATLRGFLEAYANYTGNHTEKCTDKFLDAWERILQGKKAVCPMNGTGLHLFFFGTCQVCGWRNPVYDRAHEIVRGPDPEPEPVTSLE